MIRLALLVLLLAACPKQGTTSQPVAGAGCPTAAGVYLASAPSGPSWTSYVRVAEVEAAADAVARLGGRILVAPMEVPGGDRIAVCSDPEGVTFALHQIRNG